MLAAERTKNCLRCMRGILSQEKRAGSRAMESGARIKVTRIPIKPFLRGREGNDQTSISIVPKSRAKRSDLHHRRMERAGLILYWR